MGSMMSLSASRWLHLILLVRLIKCICPLYSDSTYESRSQSSDATCSLYLAAATMSLTSCEFMVSRFLWDLYSSEIKRICPLYSDSHCGLRSQNPDVGRFAFSTLRWLP